MSAPAHPTSPPWAQAALRRASFATVVRAEFRKLAGTLSDRILLVVGPLALVLLVYTFTFNLTSSPTMRGQIVLLTVALRITPLVLLALLVKLIAGEWHYRAAQPTLLVQPSRIRYLLAQVIAALPMLLFSALVPAVLYFPGASSSLTAQDVVFLGGYRVGFVVTICVFGAFLMVFSALTIALAIPNGPGALSTFLVIMPVLGILYNVVPTVAPWADPLTPMLAVADQLVINPIGPVLTSSVLWLGLFVFALTRYLRRDTA